ncbi:MAG: LbtU family siderophore porin [Proteobacteria bacterium]|nr:LbtU family siderophore porin [Pseudomonadota bacterium]MBU4464194.1 LbtU family siderophore porin [Pseudomonadota bacterium]
MKNSKLIIIATTLCFALFFISSMSHALSPETELLLKLLEKKGVITTDEAAALKQEIETAAPKAIDKETIKAEIKREITDELKAEGGPLAGIQDNVTISGKVEIDYQYLDHRDRTNKNSDGTSDLYISTVELGIEAVVNESATANIIFKAENIDKSDNGTDNNSVDDSPEKVLFDEATITIFNQEKCPFYAVLGKRGQPFGNFFTHTISNPITKSAYEIATTGVTLGYAPADLYELDLSFSLYKGEKVMGQVSGIGGRQTRNGDHVETDDVESYIANLSLQPVNGLTIGAAFNSEPGYESRNNTINAFAEFSLAGFTLDCEYFAAAKREKFSDNKTCKEKAWAAGLAYKITEPLEIAARYETFDNDRDTDLNGDIDYTLTVGANYEILDSVTLMGEYRRLQEKATNSSYEKTANEYNLRMGIEF